MGRLATLAVFLGLLPPTVASAAPLGASLEQRLATLGPGDSVPVILEFADHADLSGFQRRSDGAAVIHRLRDHAERSQARVRAFLRARGYDGRFKSFWINNTIAVRVPVGALAELAALPDLERIEFDEPVHFDGGPVAGTNAVDWNMTKIHAEDVWLSLGLDGTGIVVGSMDTGFDPTHPALLGKWRGGSNSWYDAVNHLGTPYDDHGHGTHTIGTMVGGDGPGPFADDIGIAYNAQFISTKVLDAFNSFSSAATVIDGAQWMLDPDGNPATDDFPNVINNSWLFFSQTTAFHDAVTAWRAVGIIPVFCIGNEGPGIATTRPPGNYDNTIGVGATDVSDNIASFSSRGPAPVGAGYAPDQRKPDLSAPGDLVKSSVPGGFYSYWSGTSMASPHVAGTVALLLQANPGLSYYEVFDALINHAVDLGAVGYDYDFGYGRLDAFAVLSAGSAIGIHLDGGSTGHAVNLVWNTSTLPDVTGYNVYRSNTIQDLTPPLLASTPDTTHTDPYRLGTGYYRVKAVTLSGESPFSNEVAMTVCSASPTCVTFNANTNSPVAADFNHDGHLDIAIVRPTSSGLAYVTLGDGAGNFGSLVSYAPGSTPNSIAVGDFDGDGIADLAITNTITSGTVSILRGNGSGGVGNGTFAAPVAYPAGNRPTAIVAEDFNRDGILDLGVTCNSGSSVAILRGNGADGVPDGTFAAPVTYTVGTAPSALAPGDFNHDGALDLAVVNSSSSAVSILLGHKTGGVADGTFTLSANYPVGSSPLRIAAGDLDGDGILDLAVTRNVFPGFVTVLRGLGSPGAGNGTFAAQVQYPAGSLPQGIAIAELNGDGIPDVVVANDAIGNAATALLGDGTAAFTAPLVLTVGTGPGDIAVADFNHDGIPDLALTAGSGYRNMCVLPGACASEAGIGLALTAPNGGEAWLVGDTEMITWTKSPGVVSVDLDVSRDDGATWQKLASNLIGTSFDWIVTAPEAIGTARVRVRDARVGAEDASDAAFYISTMALAVPDTPGRGLALAIENPARDRIGIRFSLAGPEPARLEVLDVSGRRVQQRTLAGLGPGTHVLELGEGFRAGVYLVRLSQAGMHVTRKVAMMR